MRAQCIICTDHFEKDRNVAAMPCGHTFHDDCLSTWLDTQKSCPQCRKVLASKEKPIRRLYFMEPEDSICIQEEDTARLKNKLEDMKVTIKRKESEKQDAEKEKLALSEAYTQLEVAWRASEKRLQEEKECTVLLKKDLSYYKEQQTAASAAIDEAVRLRAKLQELHTLQQVVTGSEDEVQEVLARQGGGGGDPKQHAVMITLLRRELESSRHEKRGFRGEILILKKDLAEKKRALLERTDQLALVSSQLERCEEDLRSAEREREGLQRRMNALSKAVGSPTGNPAASLARRLLHESPAPSLLVSTTSDKHLLASGVKKKSSMRPADRANTNEKSATLDSQSADVTLNLFDDSLVTSPLPHGSASRPPKGRAAIDDDSDEFVKKIEKADLAPLVDSGPSGSKAGSKKRKEPDDMPAQGVSNIVGYGLSLNIMRKKNGSSIFKNGYNGLGGHGTYINTPGKSVKLTANQKTKKRTFVLQKRPPILTMEDYVVLD